MLNLFSLTMKQYLNVYKFNRKYTTLALFELGTAIELTVKIALNLYIDLNNSRIYVLAERIKTDKLNIDAFTTAIIYLTHYLKFCENDVKLNSQNMSTRASLTCTAQIKRLLYFTIKLL